MDLSEQVRERIRDEMTRTKMSQRDLAGIVGWTQSRVAHILTGHVEMKVDDLSAMAFGLGLSATELVRDRGMEFCAEMTPTELRMLERVRQLPKPVLDAVMTILQVAPNTRMEERRAAPNIKHALKRRV